MTSSVVVALRVKAPPDRAFEVFTKEIALWWRPNVLFLTTPRKPGVLSFEGGQGGRLVETLDGGKVFEIGRITAWAPPHRLAFHWRQAMFPLDLVTEVEVTFEAIGDETRVSVDHRGFDRVPQGSAGRHGMPDAVLLKHLGEWWRVLLRSYQAALSSSPLTD